MARDEGVGKSSEAGVQPLGSRARVFISYASHDTDAANAICQSLESHCVPCWMAPRDVKPGAEYADSIVHAINDAKAVVLVMSAAGIASAHVGREIERAASKRKLIIAFRIDKAPLSAALEYFLSQSQWIDVPVLGMKAALAKLEEAVQESATSSEVVASRKSIGSKMRIGIAAAAVALVVVVGLGFYLWKLNHGGAPAPTVAAITDKSIAVLPFTDMSERRDQEYFSDGLSEELIELLGKTPGLRVIARTSSFYFKGKAEKLDAIAAELHVANVLEGSVRKSGDRLRVTAQLIRADTSEHLWSETFDRDLRDVFKVQDEIASAVVAALKIHLLPTQSGLHTENLDAYNLFLQGRQSYNQGDAAGYQHAVTAFRAAIALDPGYAAAYADLALAQFWLTDDTYTGDAADIAGYESALAAAEKAVTLAPALAAGFSARGFLRAVYKFDFAGAQVDLNEAIARSPGDAMVLHRSAVLLGVLGDLPAAIAREQQALALNPLSEEICRRLGFFFEANQQFAQARPLYEKALVIAPNSAHARFNLGELYLLENQPELALAAFHQTGIEVYSLSGLAKAEYSLGHVDASRRALETLITKHGKASPWTISEVYAWRGENDQAFEWAERAYAHRDDGITWIKIDIDFRGLRNEPRYKALLKKMNLPL